MGLITLASPFQPVTTGNQTQNKNLQWAGNALVPWKYSGAAFDFGADAGDTGDAVVPILGTVPADAIGIEMWVNGNASDDYIFSATVAGHLGATGVFATNITANLLAVRWAASGGHIIEPFVASVGFVHNEGGRASKLRNLSIEEYRAQKALIEVDVPG